MGQTGQSLTDTRAKRDRVRKQAFSAAIREAFEWLAVNGKLKDETLGHESKFAEMCDCEVVTFRRWLEAKRLPQRDTWKTAKAGLRVAGLDRALLERLDQVYYSIPTASDAATPSEARNRVPPTEASDYRRGDNELAQSSAIPRPSENFLGRDQDVAAILAVLLSAPGAVAILVQGGPGFGKTSLTQAVGSHPDVVGRFGEAERWFVALETATTAAAMQDAVTRAVGGDPARGFGATLALLKQRPGLLVLDNLETPWDPVGERRAVEETLAALAPIPGLALLASFRGHEKVRGADWALVHPVAHLDPPHDTDLFCRVAGRTFPGDPDLPRLVAALGGIPLAIELVAAHAYGRTGALKGLWQRWTKVGAALAKRPDFDEERLTSLPHSIELSLRSSRLTAAARRLFRLLGQLPAGMAPEDRDAVLGGDGFDAEERLHRIGLAVERSGRLDLLPPIRDHAARHHPPEPPDSDAWPRHYLDLTRRRGEAIGTRAGEGAVARLLPEYPNIEAGIRAVLASGRRLDAMAALTGFGRLTYIASLPAPVLTELASACETDGDILGEANCIGGLGDIALRRSDHAAARRAFEAALPLQRQVGSILGEANCIQRLGDVALARSEHDAARQAFEAALPLYGQVGSILGEANCILSLGDIALRRSDHDAARQAFEAALPLHRQVGDILGEANCIQRLGDVALRAPNTMPPARPSRPPCRFIGRSAPSSARRIAS